MNLGLSLGLGSNRRAAGSLYTTANFVAAGPADHRVVIDTDSFRYARTAGGTGEFTIMAVPSGTYRITGTLSAWDGGAIGVSSTFLEIRDLFTTRFTTGTLGAFDTGTITVSSGEIKFQHGVDGQGCRVDGLFITRVS